ncbi:MAG: response regulator [Verrucomicrobia bacterium]|nr:response regulator [Verrucomicrobiota bacterium]
MSVPPSPRLPALPVAPRAVVWLGGALVAALIGAGSFLAARPLPVPFASDYLAENWGLDEGFPENSCSGIAFGPDGAMWLGTFRGMVRFNGQRFQPWAPAARPELKSASILNLFQDRRGRVWISTSDGLILHDRGQWRRWQENDGWGPRTEPARSYAEAPDGTLVISRATGRVLRWRTDGTWEELPTPPGAGGAMCAFDEAGALHAFRSGFAGVLTGGVWQRLAGDPAVQKSAVGLGQTRDGRVLLVCQRELVQLRGGGIVSRTPLSEPVGIFWRMAEDSTGTLWLPAVNAGVYRITRDGTVRQLLKADGLPSSGPTRVVHAADDGSIWVGSGVGGVARLRPRRFRHIGEAEGMGDRVILTLAPLPDGRVLLTSFGSGMAYFDGEKSVMPLDTGRLGTALIRSVVHRRDGSTWLGTSQYGLLRLDGPDLAPVASGIFGPTETINTLFEDSRGRLWVGGEHLVAVSERGAFRRVGPLGVAERASSTLFAERADGTVLLARHHEVYAYGPEGLHPQPVFRLPDLQQASTLFVDQADRVWLGTMRHGLHVWHQGEHHTLTAERGLPGDTLSSFVQDDAGLLWFGCDRLVVRADPAQLWRAARTIQPQPELQIFDQRDGLRDLDFPVATQPSVAKDARGRLWFALIRGAAMIDPATLKLETRPPPVVFESISYVPAGATHGVDLAIEPNTPALLLPAGSRFIRVSYAALDFSAPRRQRFRVRLGGERGEWQDLRSESTVSFFELPPGRHTVQVQAAGSDGAWNRTGATFAFELAPFYWQTRWFRGLLAAGFVGLVSGVAWFVAHQRIRRARTSLARERRFAEEKEALRHLAAKLTESLTPEELGRATAEASRTLLGHDAFLLVLAQSGATAGYCPFLEDTPVGAPRPEPQPARDFSLSAVLRLVFDGKPLLVNRADPAAATDPTVHERWGCVERRSASLMYAPILWSGRVTGVMSAQSYTVQRYTSRDLDLLQTLASQCGAAIARIDAETSLRQNEARLRLAMQAVRMGSWEIDPAAGTLSATPEAEAVYECAPGTLSGPIAQLAARAPEAEAAELRQRLADLVAGRIAALDFTHRVVLAVGAEKWLEVKARLQPAPGPDARARILGITTDVTARRLAELERAKLEEQLRQSQKLEAIGTLAGGIAHDFNNILTAIIGNVELARADVGPGHAAREYLDAINQSGLRARDLVRRILAFSRPRESRRQHTSLLPAAEEVVKLLRATIPASVELKITAAPRLPLVEIDSTEIHQVLLNLGTNAWHSLQHRRGRIEFSLDTCQIDPGHTPPAPELAAGRYARLSVSDTGSGIAPEVLPRIFDPFFTTKRQGEGTGLGLSVAHGIMRANGGAITVRSTPGLGSTFSLYFPVSATDPGPLAAAGDRPAATQVGRGQRILYVDDEDVLVRVVERMLSRAGYTVAGCTHPQEAIERVRAEPAGFALAITDYSMPEMTGLDLAAALRAIRPDLPVIISTGYQRPGLVEEARKLGVRAVINKADSPDELLPLIDRVLGERTE